MEDVHFVHVIKMKKIVCTLVTIFVVIFCLTPVFAENNSDVPNANEDIAVSEAMSFDEMIQKYAEEMHVSLMDAYNDFGGSEISSQSVRAGTYRELSVGLAVTTEYHPSIRFYCNTSESGGYWGITSIYKVTLNRAYKGLTKQFSGEIDCWLRSPYKIEWMVNGDFFHNGTTTASGGMSVDAKLGELVKISFNVTNSTSSNHYKYFYDHRTTSFQS